MKPYHKYISLFAFLTILFSGCVSGEGVKKDESPKNILFIAVDDLKPILGCYGDTIVSTPNIDKLASEGFVFRNNHCQQAVCAPSRASLLTGMRPDYTKVWDLKTMIRDKNPDIITLPQYFKQLGYQTAAVGKIFDYRSVDKGADSISWTYDYFNFKHNSPIGHEYVNETERVSYEITNVPDSLTTDGEVVRRTTEYLKKFANDDEPFFMAVGFYKPHLPFVVPEKYWNMYDYDAIELPEWQKDPEGAPDYATQPSWELRNGYVDIPKDYSEPIPIEKQKKLIQGYYASVSFIDQQIGNVLKELKKLGLDKNTVIVLWGDHGYHLGDHNMFCKHTNYEQATHAPLIFRADENFVGMTESPSEFIDVFPTLCELSGVVVPENIDGLSLVPIMNGSTDKVKDFAVSQYPRWGERMGYAFRDGRYRYVLWMKNFTSDQPYNEDLVVDEELYDYEVDPEERMNLAYNEEYAPVIAHMKSKAIEFFKKQEIAYEIGR